MGKNKGSNNHYSPTSKFKYTKTNQKKINRKWLIVRQTPAELEKIRKLRTNFCVTPLKVDAFKFFETATKDVIAEGVAADLQLIERLKTKKGKPSKPQLPAISSHTQVVRGGRKG